MSRKEYLEARMEAVYEAVVGLAVGPCCHSTKREIAEAAGFRDPETAGHYLRLLIHHGRLRLVDWHDGESLRHYLILDHPDVGKVLRERAGLASEARPRLRLYAG